MKQLFILFLLPFVAIEAKTVHKIVKPTYIGINNGTMNITSVETTDEATVLTFQYTGNGGDSFSPNCYIVDERGKQYAMIGQKGFNEDSLKRLVPSKKRKYELRFQPLPANTHIFDFIDDFYSWTSISYYGIRDNNTPFAVSNPLPHNEGESSFPDIDFKKDSVVIMGHIKDYNPETYKFNQVELSELHHPTFKRYYGSDIYNKNAATIDKNGNFRLTVQVYGPTWTYLRFSFNESWRQGETFLPIMLYPNDQTTIEISCLEGDNKKEIEYKSFLQKDFSKLMHNAPMILPQLKCEDDSIQYKQLTLENIEKRFKDYDALALYLSGKYGLNRTETEMLRSQLSVIVGLEVIQITNHYLYKKYDCVKSDATAEEKMKIREIWRNSDSPYYSLAFSNVRASSNLFLTIPDWSRLLNRSYMASIPSYDKLRNEFQAYKFSTILNKKVEITETGNFNIPEYTITPEFEKATRDFERQEVKLFYNQRLQHIRKWRKKGINDSLFEQAYLLCCIPEMPYFVRFISPMDKEGQKLFLPDRYQDISQSRELFNHPSIVRLAGELLWEREKSLYRELEEMAERENSQK